MTISERIFYLMEKQNKRQADLVRVLNVRPNTISDWKAKRRNPSADLLAEIAEFFGVTVDYLVTGGETNQLKLNQGIVGNNNLHDFITLTSSASIELTEMEVELLRVYSHLDIRKKNALLSYAYELEDGKT